MSSMPQTPPDRFADNEIKFAFDVSAFDASKDIPAVGDAHFEAEDVSKDATKDTIIDSNDSGNEIKDDDALNPLLLAAAIAADPHLSHHHSRHAFTDERTTVMHDWEWIDGQTVRSRQVPRSVRLGRRVHTPLTEGKKSYLSTPTDSPTFEPSDHIGRGAFSLPITPLRLSRESSLENSGTSSPSASSVSLADIDGPRDSALTVSALEDASSLRSDVTVKCMVRTRVPTPHGEVFLHLYHNNRDNKEHLAIVVDPAQFEGLSSTHAPFIRSKSLDSVWDENETAMDRITRGAYVGRLSEAGYTASSPEDATNQVSGSSVPVPLVRIHSECYTGETIGSMRCDCGEQLDEAIRRIFQPIEYPDENTGELVTIPGRGAVIYMRQEGRGIGLLSKLRAYNLQDLGYDTVQANLMLGHGADERGYEVAAAIMHDLGLGTDESTGGGVHLLTNNPDKVEKLTLAGVHISERVDMVPRVWRCQQEDNLSTITSTLSSLSCNTNGKELEVEERAARLRSAGATLIGGGVAHGPELEKYLRTKVLRMGHMLSLPSS